MRTTRGYFLSRCIMFGAWAAPWPMHAQAPDEVCEQQPPQAAQAVVHSEVAELAGAYVLTLVNTQAGWFPTGPRSSYVLLWANDSIRRMGFTRTIGRLEGLRPLAGRVASSLTDLRAGPGARTEWPEIEYVGNVLFFGLADMTDGMGDRLTITHVSHDGFWGSWYYEPGIAVTIDSATGQRLPEPRGYFCALRVAPDSEPQGG